MNRKALIDVEVGVPSPTADINLFRKQQKKFDDKLEFEGDKGYQGGSNMTTPYKKKETKN
ncbi:hypothetical protein NUACC21_71210 [Scytonema sp. NUACC21]